MNDAVRLVLAWIGFVSITGFSIGFSVSIGWHLGKIK